MKLSQRSYNRTVSQIRQFDRRCQYVGLHLLRASNRHWKEPHLASKQTANLLGKYEQRTHGFSVPGAKNSHIKRTNVNMHQRCCFSRCGRAAPSPDGRVFPQLSLAVSSAGPSSLCSRQHGLAPSSVGCWSNRCLPLCFCGVWLLVAGAVVACHRGIRTDNENGRSNKWTYSGAWNPCVLLRVVFLDPAAGCFFGSYYMYVSVGNSKLMFLNSGRYYTSTPAVVPALCTRYNIYCSLQS